MNFPKNFRIKYPDTLEHLNLFNEYFLKQDEFIKPKCIFSQEYIYLERVYHYGYKVDNFHYTKSIYWITVHLNYEKIKSYSYKNIISIPIEPLPFKIHSSIDDYLYKPRTNKVSCFEYVNPIKVLPPKNPCPIDIKPSALHRFANYLKIRSSGWK